MPQIECTVIPPHLARTFAEYRQLLDDEPTPQTLSNVLFTLMDAAARLWVLAKQKGLEIPPFEAFANMGVQSVIGHVELVRTGRTVVPAEPTSH